MNVQLFFFLPYTENTKEVKVTQNWVEFVVRRSAPAPSLQYGYIYLLYA
jgi:hypothetical protein